MPEYEGIAHSAAHTYYPLVHLDAVTTKSGATFLKYSAVQNAKRVIRETLKARRQPEWAERNQAGNCAVKKNQ